MRIRQAAHRKAETGHVECLPHVDCPFRSLSCHLTTDIKKVRRPQSRGWQHTVERRKRFLEVVATDAVTNDGNLGREIWPQVQDVPLGALADRDHTPGSTISSWHEAPE